MPTFQEFPYRRIDFEELSARFCGHLDDFRQARDTAAAYLSLIEMDHIQRVFISYATLSEAGATNDSFDAFWQDEERFFGKTKPEFELLIQRRNEAICQSPHKAELETLMGQEMIDRAELQRSTVNDAALPLMRRENDLSQRYSVLTSRLSAKDGDETLTMPELSRRGTSPEREVRRKYALLAERAYAGIADELDALYDDMVNVRTDIARATGFANLTDYCLAKHGRTGYGRAELRHFAHGVETELVPLVSALFKAQESRLGHPVMNYDEGALFPGRDVKVADDPLPAFAKVFQRLSPETKVFFDELTERRFYDLELRPGKTMGAYSNDMPLCRMPYIFETYNATEGAVRTFAHECGHGLHTFLHRGEPIMDAAACSSDVSETHSMSMEFFIWRYLGELVSEKDIPPYQYRHLRDSLAFIPYGTAIDCFQTEVYDHPELSPKQRLELWQGLERRFLPWRKYEKGLFYDQGRAWQRQIHVMKWPFYYIDYVLAQVCALQLFAFGVKDFDGAWNAYVRLLKHSGKLSFPQTVRRAGLMSPFEDGAIEMIAQQVGEYMETLNVQGG
jgi:M3 family oligoendopeptidase